MPVVDTSPYTTPILVYDAPVNEKTKKVREMFKVDEKTGYPEHYSWRPLARLGPYYNYEDPFLKFDPYDPHESVSQKVAIVAIMTSLCGAGHFVLSLYKRRPFWAKSYQFVFNSALLSGIGLWIQEKSLQRQGIRNAITMDYARKHPERFGPIHRPKAREVLLEHVPVR